MFLCVFLCRVAEKEGRFTLCAQEEALPYRYVTVEGPLVSMEAADMEKDIRPLYHRYLGREEGDLSMRETYARADPGDTVLVRMRVEHWYSADFGKAQSD